MDPALECMIEVRREAVRGIGSAAVQGSLCVLSEKREQGLNCGCRSEGGTVDLMTKWPDCSSERRRVRKGLD